MQFITFYSPATRPPPGTMPDPKHMEEMGKLMMDWMAKGILVGNGAFGMAAKGFRVTASDGDYKVRDGADHAVVPAVNGSPFFRAKRRKTF